MRSPHSSQSAFATQFENLELRQGGDVNALLQGLRDNNLTSLANVLSQHPAVTDRIFADNTEKLLLAPTDDAISKLPSWVTSNLVRLEATLLQHVLRGNFEADKFNAYPLHTIGHTLLNESSYSRLPGGAGQAVALSKFGNRTFVSEAINNDTFVSSTQKFDTVTVQPINKAITVPGSITETLSFLGYSGISTLFANVQNGALASTIDSMAGITLFVPTNDAIKKYVATAPNPAAIPTVLGTQHIVASRVVYSPLLIDQGSLISSSGQDIVFDNNAGTVKVGNFTAKIPPNRHHRPAGCHPPDRQCARLDCARYRPCCSGAEIRRGLRRCRTLPILSGPVSGKNSITTQGTDVPAAQQGSGANNGRPTTTRHRGSGQTSSGVGNGTDGNGGGDSQANSSNNGSGAVNGSNGNGSNIDHRQSNAAAGVGAAKVLVAGGWRSGFRCGNRFVREGDGGSRLPRLVYDRDASPPLSHTSSQVLSFPPPSRRDCILSFPPFTLFSLAGPSLHGLRVFPQFHLLLTSLFFDVLCVSASLFFGMCVL